MSSLFYLTIGTAEKHSYGSRIFYHSLCYRIANVVSLSNRSEIIAASRFLDFYFTVGNAAMLCEFLVIFCFLGGIGICLLIDNSKIVDSGLFY